IVRHLLGVPLAIELAAARQSNEPADHAPALGRLRTPRQALDGAWGRLSRAERVLFSQCSVFRGGFTLEAVERVIDGHESPVAALLQSFHKKALISIDTRHGEDAPRFGMCESIREHA